MTHSGTFYRVALISDIANCNCRPWHHTWVLHSSHNTCLWIVPSNYQQIEMLITSVTTVLSKYSIFLPVVYVHVYITMHSPKGFSTLTSFIFVHRCVHENFRDIFNRSKVRCPPKWLNTIHFIHFVLMLWCHCRYYRNTWISLPLSSPPQKKNKTNKTNKQKNQQKNTHTHKQTNKQTNSDAELWFFHCC